MEISALEHARQSDREELVALVLGAVDALNACGIPQWDAVYPNATHVDADLRNGQLYAARADGRIAGMITLNRQFDPEYATGDWQVPGDNFMVVHRLIVSPAMQGRGIGARMMEMAEAMLRESGVRSIRLDAFSQNPHALRLYRKLGYHTVGEAQWRKGLFYLMEKELGTGNTGDMG